MDKLCFYGYIFGWLVTTVALVQEKTTADIYASAIAAIAWPVLICARILKKIL